MNKKKPEISVAEAGNQASLVPDAARPARARKRAKAAEAAPAVDDAQAASLGPAGARLESRLKRVRSRKPPQVPALVPVPVSVPSLDLESETDVLATNSPQLPLWPEKVRGLSNTLARSALFNAGAAWLPREDCKKKEIFTTRGITIRYTGEELRTDDEDVFLQVTHIARLHPLGTRVVFSAYSVLKALKWDLGSAGYTRLHDALTRLSANNVAISSDDNTQGYSGSLVTDFVWVQKRWAVKLNPEIVRLFGTTNYTRIEWEQRLRLAPLAKKLHAYYVTHKEPFALKVETIRDLCGSRIAELSQFRPPLKKALDKLVDIGFLESWTLDKRTDVVRVVRAPQVLIPDDELELEGPSKAA